VDRWITDWEPSPRYPLYTRANAGEVLPEPASPLGWSLVFEPGVAMGWADAHHAVGTLDPEELDPGRPEVLACFGGYLYLNAAMARIFGVRAPGLTPEMVDYLYFGQHPDVPPYVPEAWHESEANTARLGEWMGRVLLAADLPELRDLRDEAEAARASRPDLTKLDDAALVARARSFIPLIRRMFERHLEVTAGASIGSGVIGAVCAAVGDPALALTLVTGVGDVDSAAPSLALWAMSRTVRSSPELMALFDAGVDGLLDRLGRLAGPESRELSSAFAAFERDHGSRGPNEWDIRSPTWETDPELALSLLDRMRLATDDASPQLRSVHNIAEREAATARVESALADQPDTLGQFQAGLHSAHLYLAGRERTKSAIIRVIHEVRTAVWELGTRHGYTPSATCMLLADELDAFVNDPTEFRARLASREQQYLTLFDLDPPFIVGDAVPPLGEWPRRTSGQDGERAAAGQVLSGIPGCPGRATGRARVVVHPSDPAGLEPGDVLVAPITDPSWTPLFVPAAAVVVDVGAQVSHAVIVSRELGIPCVVSVHDATRIIPDGAVVTVDGIAGTVTVTELPEG
jgi:pyruvate,water dikinase